MKKSFPCSCSRYKYVCSYVCKEHPLRNTRHWGVISVFQLRPHSYSNHRQRQVANITHLGDLRVLSQKCSFGTVLSKAALMPDAWQNNSSAWMELWVTTWLVSGVHPLHRTAACGHLNLKWYFDAFAPFPWFKWLRQTQARTLTSSAFHSSGRSLEDFLEDPGTTTGDSSPTVKDVKYKLVPDKRKASERIPRS